jgi:hypothetical protein
MKIKNLFLSLLALGFLFSFNSAQALSPVRPSSSANCASSDMPSITVLSPNGGEIYKAGEKMSIKWTSCNMPNDAVTRLLLTRNLPGNYQDITVVLETSDNYNIRKGSYVWRIPKDITLASGYSITIVCGLENTNCPAVNDLPSTITDTSDNSFTINSGKTTTCPSDTPPITVLLPNGKEKYTAGQQIKVRWKTCNISSTAPISLEISTNYGATYGIIGGEQGSLNDGFEVITLPNNQSGWTPLQFGRNFKVKINVAPNGFIGDNPIFEDYSDNWFTIKKKKAETKCTSDVPSIKVLSPNGKEKYTAGQQIKVRWKSCNIPEESVVTAQLNSTNGTSLTISPLTIANNLPTPLATVNDGNEIFALPQSWKSNMYSFSGYGKNFKLQLAVFILKNGNWIPSGDLITDQSDNLFTIAKKSE